MTDQLQLAIENILEIVTGDVSGIRAAPKYLPEAINVYPTLVCYAGSGYIEGGNPAGSMRGMHNIILELHIAGGDLPRTQADSMSYASSIPAALLNNPTLNSTVSTFGRITYIFGSMVYGKINTIGFRWTIEDVKIQEIL